MNNQYKNTACVHALNVQRPLWALTALALSTALVFSDGVSAAQTGPRKSKKAEPKLALNPAQGLNTPNTQASEVISLKEGFQQVLPVKGTLARVSVGDPDVADISPLKPVAGAGSAGVLVVGKRPGSTSVLIWEKGQALAKVYTILVTGSNTPSTANIKGLNIDTDGNLLRLSGNISNVGAYQQLRDGLTRSRDGKAATDLVDTTTLTVPGTVQVDVKVVEFSRSELQKAGINLAKANGNFAFGTFQPSSSAIDSTAYSTALGIAPTSNLAIKNSLPLGQAFNLVAARNNVSPLAVQLSLLESGGYARVLAEPSLIAQSGQVASFLAGGEFPVPVPSGASNSISIQYKPFGVKLDFTPTVLSDKAIALKVAPEVSELDFSKGISINGIQVPALLTRRTDTTVELGEGESFVIGGLVSRNVLANVDRVPGLADIPILGAFFKRLSYEKTDKELLIIVTPRFVKPRAKDAPALPLPGDGLADKKPSFWNSVAFPADAENYPGFSR